MDGLLFFHPYSTFSGKVWGHFWPCCFVVGMRMQFACEGWDHWPNAETATMQVPELPICDYHVLIGQCLNGSCCIVEFWTLIKKIVLQHLLMVFLQSLKSRSLRWWGDNAASLLIKSKWHCASCRLLQLSLQWDGNILQRVLSLLIHKSVACQSASGHT